MTVMAIITPGVDGLDDAIGAFLRFGGSRIALNRDIAAYGEASTRARFRTQVGPDGKAWKPSIRVRLRGGKTLTDRGHLGNSITSAANQDEAMWGTNMAYARIQQLGGTIVAKTARALRFRIGGQWVMKRRVTLPARPFLGVNEQDETQILDLAERRVARLGRGG